jgi:drug/metabolite transporter (DMT)-like permease
MSNAGDNIRRGVLYALATAFIASISMTAGKVLAGMLNAPMIMFVQYSLCLLFIFPYAFRNNSRNAGRRVWHTQYFKIHFIRGFGGWLGFLAMYIALLNIPLVDGALLRNTAPLFVPLVVWLWVGVVVPKNRWVALIIGFIGVTLILRSHMQGTEFNVAYLWALASGCLLAVSIVGTRLLSKTESSSTIMFYYFSLSAVMSAPLALFYWQPIPADSWPYLLWLSVSMFVAMWLYTKSYQYAKPSIISPISYFTVVFSGLIGWFMWGHIPSVISFFGMLLVVLAGVITVYLGGKEQEALISESAS